MGKGFLAIGTRDIASTCSRIANGYRVNYHGLDGIFLQLRLQTKATLQKWDQCSFFFLSVIVV